MLVNSGENITIDSITYNFENFGVGEAPDTTLIYLPLQRLLFTGDVVNDCMHPALIGGHSKEWLDQLKYIFKNYPDAKILFPGHGTPRSQTLLNEQLDYINTFRSLVKAEIQSARDVDAKDPGNITEQGKQQIISTLQKIYPNYIGVASIPIHALLDLNINAISSELINESSNFDAKH